MSKTIGHFLIIIVIGIGLGLGIRQVRRTFQGDRVAGPAPDEQVFTLAEEDEIDPDRVTNDTPTRPPADEAWASRFDLIERSGDAVASEDLLGEPYVVSFFFSTCPSICVQQNQKLRELQDEFEGRGVRFVAISVDPETDTPEVLREYAARFGADEDQWLFMTAELNYIRKIGAEIFRQPVNKKFHTERFVLVDAEGNVEGFYNWPEERQFEALQDKIAELLKQTEAKES